MRAHATTLLRIGAGGTAPLRHHAPRTTTGPPRHSLDTTALAFFAIAVAFKVPWTAISSLLGQLSTQFARPAILLQLNLAYFLPSLPALLLQSLVQERLDQRLGVPQAALLKYCLGLGGLAVLALLLPSCSSSPAAMLWLTGAVGVAYSVAFGTSYQLVARFPPNCTVALTTGFVSCGVVVLVADVAIKSGPYYTPRQLAQLSLVVAGSALIGLWAGAALLRRHWHHLAVTGRRELVTLDVAAKLGSRLQSLGSVSRTGSLSSGHADAAAQGPWQQHRTHHMHQHQQQQQQQHGLHFGGAMRFRAADPAAGGTLAGTTPSSVPHDSSSSSGGGGGRSKSQVPYLPGSPGQPAAAGVSGAHPGDAWQQLAMPPGGPGGTTVLQVHPDSNASCIVTSSSSSGISWQQTGQSVAGQASSGAAWCAPAAAAAAAVTSSCGSGGGGGGKGRLRRGLSLPAALQRLARQALDAGREARLLLPLLAAISAPATALLLSVGSSMLAFPFFTFVPLTGRFAEHLPQVLFYSRLGGDILGRLAPPRWQLRTRGAVLTWGVAKAALLLVLVPALLRPRLVGGDGALAALVAGYWWLSGFVNVGAYLVAPGCVAPEAKARVGGLMALCFQASCFAGLSGAALLQRSGLAAQAPS